MEEYRFVPFILFCELCIIYIAFLFGSCNLILVAAILYGNLDVTFMCPLDPSMRPQVQKKKLWEAVQPELKTDAEGVASFKGITMLTSAGAIKAPTLTGGNIS